MLEKLLLRKFWKIITKSSLVVFLLKNWSCPIPPPSPTNSKADSIANISFPCFENFKIGLRSSAAKSLFNEVAETSGFCNSVQHAHSTFQKGSSPRHFEKSPFNKSSRLTIESLNATKNELLVIFLKGALKFTENFQEVISIGFPYPKFTNLQTAAVNLACF